MARYTYVISDIHGQYDALMEMVKKIDFGYDDEMYIIGDLIDRGDKSIECIKWVMEQDNILTLLGNHELLFLDNFIHNVDGIYSTVNEVRQNLSAEEINDIIRWIDDMPECKIINIDGKRFYLNHTQAVNPNYFKENLTDRMFPDYDRYMSYYNYSVPNIISIFGHIPTMQMRQWNNQEKNNTIWSNKDNTIYDIDCGAGYPKQGGCLGCLRLNDMKEFYVNI